MTWEAAGLVLAHGADPTPPFSVARLATLSRPDPLLMVVVVALVAAYVVGVRRLAARGDRWPIGRSAAFALGVGLVLLATASGLAAYEDTLFSAHMAQHMVLTMAAPIALALSAPVTLALRTVPPAARRRLLAVLHSRVARVLAFPPVGWVLFVGTPFALYFSGLYQATLHSDLLHELMHVHFLAVGCLFFWSLLGVDPLPGRVSYPLRLLAAFATLPFHAFLGIAVMGASTPIAAAHYLSLGRSPAQVLADQEVGGGLLWASGDLVGIVMVAVLVWQWMRQSEREARREDRRLDRLDSAAGTPVSSR